MLHPDFLGGLEAVVLHALVDPAARFQSAAEMKQAYYDAVKGLPPDVPRQLLDVPGGG